MGGRNLRNKREDKRPLQGPKEEKKRRQEEIEEEDLSLNPIFDLILHPNSTQLSRLLLYIISFSNVNIFIVIHFM